jgi:ParB family chromosome partitioning protein
MARKRVERTDQIFQESELITAAFAQREGAIQQFIPLDALVPNRFNPRRTYSKEALDELIQSMREHGFIGALDGRQLSDGRVEVAYGSRRLLAARAVGVQAIPVFLHDWDDHELMFISLIENLIREDLSAVEQADTVGQMHEQLGLSVREIARKTGKPRSWVEDRLALHRAPKDVREMVLTRPDTLRTANYISRIPDQSSRQALEGEVVEERVTARQVQQAVQYVVEEQLPASEALARATSSAPRASRPMATTDERAAPLPRRAPASLTVLLARANRALGSFNPEGIAERELGNLVEELRQLTAKANALIEELNEGLQGA